MILTKSFSPLILLFLISYNKLAAQNDTAYIERINQYQKEVDSLVFAFVKIPPSDISHAWIHYYCVGKSGGSFAELYRNAKGQVIQLTWQSNCDSLFEDKVFYFIDDKIVLATDGALAAGKRGRKYYKDGVLLLENDLWIDKPISNDAYLAKGYSVLKDFKK